MLVGCAVCGGYGSVSPKRLLAACPGKATQAGQRSLGKIAQGVHPDRAIGGAVGTIVWLCALPQLPEGSPLAGIASALFKEQGPPKMEQQPVQLAVFF